MVKNFENYFNENNSDMNKEIDDLFNLDKDDLITEGRPKGAKNKPKPGEDLEKPLPMEEGPDKPGNNIGDYDDYDYQDDILDEPKTEEQAPVEEKIPKPRKVRKAKPPEEPVKPFEPKGVKEPENNNIEAGDTVKVINWDDLTEKQANFLRSKTEFVVFAVTGEGKDRHHYDPAIDNEPYIDIGYNIPLKMKRFAKVVDDVKKPVKPAKPAKPVEPELKSNEYIDLTTGEVKTFDFKDIPKLNTFPFIMSAKLKKFLGQFEAYSAHSLLMADKTGEESIYTFVDIASNPDSASNPMFSYIPVAKLGYLSMKLGIDLKNKDSLLDERNPLWTSTSRASMRIGGFINDLYGDFYDANDIESFANEWKAQVNAEKIYAHFKIITGQDIKKYYNADYYDECVSTLGQSCMTGKNNKMVDLYCENPKKVGLLCLFNDKGDKIKARAVIWMGLRKPAGRWFVDRIYSVKDDIVKIYKAYCRKNGWLYKDLQVRYEINSYMDNGVKIKGGGLSIELKPKKYGLYPYMDTMKLYTPETGRIGSTAGNNIGMEVLYIADPGGNGKIFDFKRGLSSYDDHFPRNL